MDKCHTTDGKINRKIKILIRRRIIQFERLFVNRSLLVFSLTACYLQCDTISIVVFYCVDVSVTGLSIDVTLRYPAKRD